MFRHFLGVFAAALLLPFQTQAQADRSLFNRDRDLLLAHFDCKTDVDDLHSVAAIATMLRQPAYSDVRYHAVAGAYGVQEGLYVPPNPLFKLAFGDHWSDAHADFDAALNEVFSVVSKVLSTGGDIWIPEAGQSDFSAALVRRVREALPEVDSRSRIHIVQHSHWNEEVTDAAALAYVKQWADYQKIPDGNVVGNGTPGFRADAVIPWENWVKDPGLIRIWQLALELGNTYNGVDGRYLNTSVAAGGLDFSDVSETCWIFGQEHLSDATAFFTALFPQ